VEGKNISNYWFPRRTMGTRDIPVPTKYINNLNPFIINLDKNIYTPCYFFVILLLLNLLSYSYIVKSVSKRYGKNEGNNEC